MTIIFGIFCLVDGFILGRIYSWMKYHYPEFQEMIRLKTAKLRAERMRYEAEAQEIQDEINDEYERRLNEHQEGNFRRKMSKT